jgi:hypothetical protein
MQSKLRPPLRHHAIVAWKISDVVIPHAKIGDVMRELRRLRCDFTAPRPVYADPSVRRLEETGARVEATIRRNGRG